MSKTSKNPKIDNQAVLGLLGTKDSLAYKVNELERHFHNRERWFGAAAVPSGETHVADIVGGATTPFALLSGNSDFGNWVQILGSSDTPVFGTAAYFDAHEFIVTTTDSTSPFIIEISAGESGDLAGNITAGLYTTTMYISASNNNDSGIETIASSRVPTGVKVWARCACIGQDAKTINAYIGLHEYEG